VISELRDRLWHEMGLRRKLYNELVDERGKIRVHCRIRPILRRGCPAAIVEPSGEEHVAVTGRDGKRKAVEFDWVHGAAETQSAVFEAVRPLITSVVDGFNVCLLAYGQTGSGKSYTIVGDEEWGSGAGIREKDGITVRSLHHLFEVMSERKADMQFRVSVSCVEIYNNDIYDLMAPAESGQRSLDVQSTTGVVVIPGLLSAEVSAPSEALDIIRKALSGRVQRPTLLNVSSSRSHAIVNIAVEGTGSLNGEQRRARLCLVDLAGSECVGRSGAEGVALEEAKNVNKSLSAFRDVMEALAKRQPHIPYRNAQLTHYLMDCIGGTSKMLLFVNVSPEADDSAETMHALTFGTHVRQVERPKAAAAAVSRPSSIGCIGRP